MIENNRTQKFVYNLVSTAFLQIVTMIVGFITPRIILVYYGSEINGLVSSISEFISYFNLVEAGLAGAAIYSLYKPLAQKDNEAISGVVSAAKRFYLLSGYIFVSLVLGLAFIYPAFVGISALSPVEVGLLVLVVGASGALEFFTMSKYRVLLSADQRTYVISLASIVSIVLNATVIVVLGSMRVNIVLMRFVALSSVFVRSFILYFYTKRRYKNISFSATPNVKALDKRWSALFLQILGVVQSSAPIVLLTIVFNKNMAIISVYSIFNMIIGGINGVLSIFVTGLSASFGDIIAKNEINTLQKSTREFEFAYYSLLTVVYSIAMVMLMPFIRIYTQGINDINYNLPIVGFLFVLNGLLYNVKTPQGMLVISAGHYKETRVQSTIQAVIIIVFGIILTPKLGLVGILIASCLSNLYRDIDLLFYIPKKVTNLPVKSTFFRIVCIFVSGGLICLPMFFININPLTFLEWFITAAVVGVYAVAVVLVIALIFERRELKNVYLRVLRLLPSSRKKD